MPKKCESNENRRGKLNNKANPPLTITEIDFHQAMPFYKGIEQKKSDMFSKFNPGILLEFVSRLMSTLVGKEAMLTNGRIGTIIRINPYVPLKVLLKTSTDH
ncbi:hypothetical protein Q8G35_09785 [Peribacillus simplex]|uniref:Uncharacterized protein n=2 Tax=Peribacillus TaxID=2675229 RepID=A0AA90P8D3_9BACI|nr:MULTISPECIES: hypothetical protein [Peribacillus]MDP1418700.1 hypothetical protein [Peribacillus simplex]MDP1450754.1 hypothetical protein [Peribacillus frigoritolerans]